jgi:hypothetical protein
MKFKYKPIKNDDKTTFLHRLSFYLKKGSIKLHIITGDDSPVFHTHPWDFTSFILFGGYKEYIKFPWDTNVHWTNSLSPPQAYRAAERVMKQMDKRPFMSDIEDTTGLIFGWKHRIFSINKKHHEQLHRVELFKVLGIKIPAITIGFYSEKLELCSFCKQLGYCKQNKPNGIRETNNPL